ncbi:MAG: hypothetical protein QM647_08920 [Asticcacaulis sp.]|uniref:hypothetical protein n=1 Tax=Asticcacaulis sp. TaxID=1872648 RepID=UPI0039E6BE90
MNDIKELEDYISSLGGYDLQEIDLGKVEVVGWEGFPTHKWGYRKPNATKPESPHYAEVIMLNPTANQVARWIVTAITDTFGAFDMAKAKKIADHCLDQSGFQFPVRGVHLEQEPYLAYAFFDGVTVWVDGWDEAWPHAPIDKRHLDLALSATYSDIKEAYKWARIQGTGRADYTHAGGRANTDGKNWLKVVRDCYQQAWGKDANFLMLAEVKSYFGA